MSRKNYEIKVEISNGVDKKIVTHYTAASNRKLAIKNALKDFMPGASSVNNPKIEQYLNGGTKALTYDNKGQEITFIVVSVTLLKEYSYEDADGETQIAVMHPINTKMIDKWLSCQTGTKKPFLAHIETCISGYTDYERFVVWASDKAEAKKQAILQMIDDLEVMADASEYLNESLEVMEDNLSYSHNDIAYEVDMVNELSTVKVLHQGLPAFYAVLMPMPNRLWSLSGNNRDKRNVLCPLH